MKGHSLDAGHDLAAAHDGIVSHGSVTVFSTGVYGDVPAGMVGLVFARSGLGVKHGVRPVNAVGVIDAGYTGEVMVALTRDITEGSYMVREGDRIAQLVYMPLGAYMPGVGSVRGGDGFGSTGA